MLIDIILQEFHLLSALLLLAVTVNEVVGYSSGAPNAACAAVTPQHTTPQTTSVPFIVNISSLEGGYIPEQNYTSE